MKIVLFYLFSFAVLIFSASSIMAISINSFSELYGNNATKVFEFVIENKDVFGPVNVSSPGPVTNKEFTKALGRVLKRPTVFGVPGVALKMLMGEFAKEVLLTSIRAEPKKLIENGFEFKYPELETALKEILGKG